MSAEHNDGLRLSDDDAHRLLMRAAELDGAHGSEVSVRQLRQIAIESGIGPDAFDAALLESRSLAASGRSGPKAAQHGAAVSAPAWVRLCMFGVPDRRAATAFYWLFVLAMCAWPLRVLVGTSGPEAVPGTVAGMAFCGFALWSTSRAIRWLDKHGWSSLR